MTNVETITKQAAPHSCLRCGRVVTKREQHEELEERVLEAIRAGRPDWAEAGSDDDSAPHVERLRELLRLRKRRGEDESAESMSERVRRQQQMTFLLQILFAVVAVATMVLLAPADWLHYFQNNSNVWRTRR